VHTHTHTHTHTPGAEKEQEKGLSHISRRSRWEQAKPTAKPQTLIQQLASARHTHTHTHSDGVAGCLCCSWNDSPLLHCSNFNPFSPTRTEPSPFLNTSLIIMLSLRFC